MEEVDEIVETALALENRLHTVDVAVQQEPDIDMATTRDIGTRKHDARRVVATHRVQGNLYRLTQ